MIDLIKNILYWIKIRKRPFKFDVIKTSYEDYEDVKYKGTDIKAARKICHISHPDTRIGKLMYGKHVSIRSTVTLDLVGDIIIGNYVIFSDNVKVLTHEHNVKTKSIIMQKDEIWGVVYSNIIIGNDVYIGIDVIITEKVNNIPDGVVIGANTVLTKNPEPYTIWAGVPGRKIGTRI